MMVVPSKSRNAQLEFPKPEASKPDPEPGSSTVDQRFML